MSEKSQNEENEDNNESFEEEEEGNLENKNKRDVGTNISKNDFNNEENKENEIENNQKKESDKLEEEENEEDDNNNINEISQEQINLEIQENKKKDEDTQKDDINENEDNIEEKKDEIQNEKNDIKEYIDVEENEEEKNEENEEEKNEEIFEEKKEEKEEEKKEEKEEEKNEDIKEKEINEEEKKQSEIRKIIENLKPICQKSKSLAEKLKGLINTFHKEIQDNNNKRNFYAKQLNAINKEMKSEYDKKMLITEDMKNLENVITTKLNNLNECNKIKRSKNTVERNKKDLFLYRNSEALIKIKKMQLKNVSKLNRILDKDISKINFNLKRGFYIDHIIKEENPKIKTKMDELNYIYNKLMKDISMVKNEIFLLKNIRDSHNKCNKHIEKLNQEYKSLKEKKDINICYFGIKVKNKEMNEIRRKQIIQNKSVENFKHKRFIKLKINNDINNKKNFLSNGLKKFMALRKKNNSLYILNKNSSNTNNTNNTTNIKNYKSKSFVNSEINNITSNERCIDININTNVIFDKTHRNIDKSLEKKYKDLLQLKIDEKNKKQRIINFQLKEMNKEKNKKEAELTEKETKRFSIQKSNFYLENIKKINENKIKRLNKELNELKMQEQKYDKKIAHKEEAFSRLKKMIESVSNMRYIDI